MKPANSIVCLGEVLWDALPSGLFAGGAPLNVAVHLAQLGIPVALASGVGKDRLGRTLVQALTRRGVGCELMQTDEHLETGFVNVTFRNSETPEYEIVAPAAWDRIELTAELEQAAEKAGAIVYGSLGQRAARSRETIQSLLGSPGLKVFDVNLRPPFVDRGCVCRGRGGSHPAGRSGWGGGCVFGGIAGGVVE